MCRPWSPHCWSTVEIKAKLTSIRGKVNCKHLLFWGVFLGFTSIQLLYLWKALTDFLQIWRKCSLPLKDKLIRIVWPKVKEHFDGTKHILGKCHSLGLKTKRMQESAKNYSSLIGRLDAGSETVNPHGWSKNGFGLYRYFLIHSNWIFNITSHISLKGCGSCWIWMLSWTFRVHVYYS